MSTATPSNSPFNFDGVVPLISEEESLFSRDVDGQLIRVEKATAEQFDEKVTLEIDGVSVTVAKAQPTRNAQGDVIRGSDGEPIPRPTTIFDAAAKAFVKDFGDQHPIASLCHKEHLPPVGVCRVCVVEATEDSGRGKRTKLVPSCIQRVSDGMIIHTTSSPDAEAAARIQKASGTIVELLLADHAPGAAAKSIKSTSRPMELSDVGHGPIPGSNIELVPSPEEQPGNELLVVAEKLGIGFSRFDGPSKSRGSDNSSRMISVDHDQCIMCGRCARGCNWVKHNDVIGRGEKGYDSRIVFDLDNAMAESSCVSCGECAVSCPTGALTFQPTFIATQGNQVRADLSATQQVGDVVSVEELQNYPIFRDIPYKFLQFNGASVVRRIIKAGGTLCKEGEYGSTAFLIMSGKLEVYLAAQRGAVRNRSAGGLDGFFGGIRTFTEKIGGNAFLGDSGGASLSEDQRIFMTPEDLIVGEMTCLNRYPRSATVKAVEDTEVLEIKRNVLFMLQRNAVSREKLEQVYRKRSLNKRLANLDLFSGLPSEDVDMMVQWLAPRVDLVTVDPGQTIFKQSEIAEDFFIVALGFVKVSQNYGRGERVLNYLGPGHSFGEIGLLADFDHENVPGARRTRTATCSALDHVELIRVSSEVFDELITRSPSLRQSMEAKAKELLARDRKTNRHLNSIASQDYLEQGLYMAQSLLVLDLERCTRCDECTKACSDTHDGVTRLIRDGLRFDKYLIASSCRSCMDPYCLVGCPVDAIHRSGKSLEIEIEDYCIGCGLCASNCPYGNINMHGFPKMELNDKGKLKKVYDHVDGKKLPVVQQRATTCDLCTSVDGKPSCVYACPHDAAHRMTGAELLKRTR